jgi:uncharacterized protein
MRTVSNTSPIFNLACIGRLDLLRDQLATVFIPAAVEKELKNVPDKDVRKVVEEAQKAGWIKTRPNTNRNLITLLTVELHEGEAEAIALALEMKADHLLVDEREGRLMARQLGLPVIGVLGVLLRAKKRKRLKAIKPEIEKLKSKARFFIASDLETAILKKARE